MEHFRHHPIHVAFQNLYHCSNERINLSDLHEQNFPNDTASTIQKHFLKPAFRLTPTPTLSPDSDSSSCYSDSDSYVTTDNESSETRSSVSFQDFDNSIQDSADDEDSDPPNAPNNTPEDSFENAPVDPEVLTEAIQNTIEEINTYNQNHPLPPPFRDPPQPKLHLFQPKYG